MNRRLLAFLPGLLLMGAAARAAGPSVSASEVWLREAPPGVQIMAGYLTLANRTGKPLRLDSVSSPEFARVMVHRTVQKNGMDSMEAVAALTIPAHGRVRFAPGGYHLMLMQPRRRFYAGELITLTFNFSDHSVLSILAPVRRGPPRH